MLQIPWKFIIAALFLCIVPGKAIWLSAQEDTGAGTEATNEGANEPAKDSPLLVEPEGPEELFKAGYLMYRLGRLDLSSQYFEKLVSDNPPDGVLISLRDEYGPDVFLKLARVEELKKQTIPLLEKVNQAFKNQVANPGRIDKLLGMMVNDKSDRAQVLEDLHAAGPYAVPRIILLLQQDLSVSDRAYYIQALTSLGPQALPPILGAMETFDDDLKTEMIQAIGRLGTKKEASYLWHPAFSEDSPTGVRQAAGEALAKIYNTNLENIFKISQAGVIAELELLVKTCFSGQLDLETNQQGMLTYWKWDPEKKTVFPIDVTKEEATVLLGKMFAGQLVDLDPENEEAQALFTGLSLESDRLKDPAYELPKGPGSAYDLALSNGSELLKRTLELALEFKQIPTAITALRILSQTATVHDLSSTDKFRSPVLIEALNYPNPVIQFEAAKTILSLGPTEHFRGSSRVVPILSRTINDTGMAACLVVDPNLIRGNEMASLLREANYQTDVVPHGREGFRLAADRGNIEFILLHMNTIRWDLSQTIANLRADSRTSGIPIFIYGPEKGDHQVTSLMTRYPKIHYLVEVKTKENLDPQLKPYISVFSDHHIPEDQRREMMKEAASLLAEISIENQTKLFPIASAEDSLLLSLTDPELAKDSLRALSSIPTKKTQVVLEEIASNKKLPPDARILAAEYLAKHIQKHSLLLEDRDILKLKTQWQEEKNTQVANALSAVMGILQPNASRIGTRLRAFRKQQLDSSQNVEKAE